MGKLGGKPEDKKESDNLADSFMDLKGLGKMTGSGNRVVLARLPTDDFKIKRIVTAPVDNTDDFDVSSIYRGKRGVRPKQRQRRRARLRRDDELQLRRPRRYSQMVKTILPADDEDDDDDDDDEPDVVEEVEYVDSMPQREDIIIQNEPKPMVQYIPVPIPQAAPPKRKKAKKQKVQVQLQLPEELVEAMKESKKQREKPKQTVQIIEVERKSNEPPPTPPPPPPPPPPPAEPAAPAAPPPKKG